MSKYNFAAVVRRTVLDREREQIGQYDTLTTGDAAEYRQALEQATRFGGSTLTAIQLAGEGAFYGFDGVSQDQEPLIKLEEVA